MLLATLPFPIATEPVVVQPDQERGATVLFIAVRASLSPARAWSYRTVSPCHWASCSIATARPGSGKSVELPYLARQRRGATVPFLPVTEPVVVATARPNVIWDTEDILEHAAKMGELRKTIYDKAKRNLDAAQKKDKFYYDRKHSDSGVCRNIINTLSR